MSERFIIEQQISARASADAFLAYDTKSELKVRLRRIHSQMTPEQLESVSAAFLVTQRQLALVKSDLVQHITESGIDEQGAWLSLPYYESQQLLDAFALPMSLPEFHNLASQLLLALQAIHEQNLVHGALNTNSIDVMAPETANGRIGYRIRDLGMRRLMLLVQNPTAISSLPSDAATLAPELFHSQDAQPTTDLYMAGHLLYYLVAGGHPFVGLDHETCLQKHLAHDIVLAHTVNPDIPAEVSAWLDKLTQPEPSHRFQTTAEALSALPFIAADIHRQPTSFVFDKGRLTTTQAIQAKAAKAQSKPPAYLYLIGVLALVVAVSLYYVFRSEQMPDASDTAPPAPVEVVTVEIKATATGTITGADLATTESEFRIGTSQRGATPWGQGRSENASGPDLGASYRAYVVFKIADIIDADPSDTLINVASLQQLQLELSFNKKNKVSFLPMLYAPEILKKNNPQSITQSALDIENGMLAIEKGNTYTFTLANIDLSDAQYSDHIVFMITASKQPTQGEILNLAKTTLSLKVSK